MFSRIMVHNSLSSLNVLFDSAQLHFSKAEKLTRNCSLLAFLHQIYNREPSIPPYAFGCEYIMGNKRNVVLYLDRELVEKTKSLGFNLSKTVENYLKQLITRFSHVNTQNNGGINIVGCSPGEIRTLVSGSKAQEVQNQSFMVSDIDWIVSDFWQYCKIEERLSKKVSRDYKNVAKRFLLSCNGKISRQSIRAFLKPYLQKKPKTYNNIIDGLRAFIKRYLQKPEFLSGFKHTHVPMNYDNQLPTKEQLKKGFEALDFDKERAIFLFYASTGLRRSEVLNLTKDDIDFETRCVKAKHDTRTKRAGATFYNKECEVYLKKYLSSRTDNNQRLFRIGYRKFQSIWKKVTKASGFKITPQVLRKWHSTMLGELGVPDRFVDVFQGRAPKSVLAKHYTGNGLVMLKRIYYKVGLQVLN